MKRQILKKVGKGFIYGFVHPARQDHKERHKDMDNIDTVLDNMGIRVGQLVLGGVLTVGFLYVTEKVEHKINEMPVDVRTVKKDDKEK